MKSINAAGYEDTHFVIIRKKTSPSSSSSSAQPYSVKVFAKNNSKRPLKEFRGRVLMFDSEGERRWVSVKTLLPSTLLTLAEQKEQKQTVRLQFSTTTGRKRSYSAFFTAMCYLTLISGTAAAAALIAYNHMDVVDAMGTFRAFRAYTALTSSNTFSTFSTLNGQAIEAIEVLGSISQQLSQRLYSSAHIDSIVAKLIG